MTYYDPDRDNTWWFRLRENVQRLFVCEGLMTVRVGAFNIFANLTLIVYLRKLSQLGKEHSADTLD